MIEGTGDVVSLHWGFVITVPTVSSLKSRHLFVTREDRNLLFDADPLRRITPQWFAEVASSRFINRVAV
jgi:hypothetical protein